ncbi:MAG: hypothetical protein U1E45_10095 [Geminicoccaceae bacterium]
MTGKNENGLPVEVTTAADATDRAEVEAARRRELLRKAGAWAAAAPIMLALFDPIRAEADCIGDPECELSF